MAEIANEPVISASVHNQIEETILVGQREMHLTQEAVDALDAIAKGPSKIDYEIKGIPESDSL